MTLRRAPIALKQKQRVAVHVYELSIRTTVSTGLRQNKDDLCYFRYIEILRYCHGIATLLYSACLHLGHCLLSQLLS